MDLNILIQGQSNAYYVYADGLATQLAAEVERLLGFDGEHDRVTVLGGPGVSAISGTPFLPGGLASATNPSWLNATGTPAHPWRDGPEQSTLDGYLASLPPRQRAAPTAIVWLHNESDGFNPQITPGEWSSGVAYAIRENRAALGLAAENSPAFFVFVPYDAGPSLLGPLLEGSVGQSIKLGLQALIDDPDFRGAWGAQAGDADMNGTDPFYGGMHMGRADLAATAHRLALAIADQFASYARPGSVVTHGGVDWTGPSVTDASLVADRPNAVLARLSVPADGGMLQPLSDTAAQGAGWTIQDGPTALFATAADLQPDGSVLISFAEPVPTAATARLFYGYGGGRIAPAAALLAPGPRQIAGRGAAIYDGNQMPLQAPSDGLALGMDGQAGAPVVLGKSGATLTGSAQFARVALGPGAATVQAGAGAAEIDNSVGTATVIGGAGDLTVRGGAGSLHVQGGAGSLFAAGGLAGHDWLQGGDGNAVLSGTDHDTLTGGAGSTFALFGEDGTFFGGAGAATVAAAGGALTAVLAAGATLIFGGNSQAAAIQVHGGTGPLTFVGHEGSDSIAGGDGGGVVWAGAGQTTVQGGAGAIAANGNADARSSLVVEQGHGDATVRGGGGVTTVYGAADAPANLTVQIGAGAATVAGGAGRLALQGGDGPAVLFLGTGASEVQGGAGALDVLADPGSGVASIAAGSGNLSLTGGGGQQLDISVAEGAAGGVYQFAGLRPGFDHLRLQGYGADAAVTALSSATELAGGGVEITLADKSRIVLFGVDRAHAATLLGR
jgi:Ca2+-binding RTX toxin-like protein